MIRTAQTSILLAMLFLSATITTAAIPENYALGGKGVIRYLGFIKVYDASLYVEPGVMRDEILSSKSSRCLQLTYDVELKAADFMTAAETILAQQHDDSTLERVRQDIDLLHQNYRDVKPGNSYTLCYDNSSQTTSLLLDGQPLVSITSAEFASVYFGIWLGEFRPLDKKLRTQLLKGLSEKVTI